MSVRAWIIDSSWRHTASFIKLVGLASGLCCRWSETQSRPSWWVTGGEAVERGLGDFVQIVPRDWSSSWIAHAHRLFDTNAADVAGWFTALHHA